MILTRPDRAPDRLVERGADGAPMQSKDSSTSVKTRSDTSRPGLPIYRQPSNSYEPLGSRLTGFLLSYRTKPWIGVKGWLPVNSKVAQIVTGAGVERDLS